MRTIKIENREEAEEIIKSCKTCYLALSNNDLPYVVPMNFALDGNTVILHSAQTGRKWELLNKNPRVCINWTAGDKLAWQDVGVGCSYRVRSRSVIVEGVAEIVEDFDEKVRCLGKLMAQYSPLAFNFSKPSVVNVGVFKVHIRNLSAFRFGAKAITPWNQPEEDEGKE